MSTKRRVVIQLGHVGRKTGATGAPGEQDYLISLGPYVQQALVDAGYEVKMVPASFGRLTCDAFLALHCDGSTDLNAGGFSVGYPSKDTGTLARRIAAAYETRCPFKFRGFNITVNMRSYYGYCYVTAPGRALLELGFITNPKERDWLRSHKQVVAQAIREGLDRFFLTSNEEKKNG